VGNHLNGNTFNGRAYGIKLDVLLKLGDTKTVDNKKTLLHFILSFIEKSNPDVIDWMTELEHIILASKVSQQTIRDDMNVLRSGLKLVKDQIDLLESSTEQEINKSYRFRIESFYSQAENKLKIVESDLEEMYKKFSLLASQYGEEPDSYTWEEFFKLLLQFNESFEKAKSDIDREKQEQIKKVRRVQPRRRGDSNTIAPSTGLSDVLEDQKNPTTIEERRSVRRAKSIRKVTTNDSKTNLNSLLTMLDMMNN